MSAPELTPGVHRILGPAEATASALRQAGWVAVVIPPTRRMRDFYAVLADRLGWPDYFGANLDALWDCLTDLTRPTAVVVDNWTVLAHARPERWAAVLAVFAERTEQPPPFAVVLS